MTPALEMVEQELSRELRDFAWHGTRQHLDRLAYVACALADLLDSGAPGDGAEVREAANALGSSGADWGVELGRLVLLIAPILPRQWGIIPLAASAGAIFPPDEYRRYSDEVSR